MEQLANYTIGQLIGGGIGIFAVLSIFIQISPIKWNPLTSLAKCIGKALNAEMYDKIDNMSVQVRELADEVENEREESVKRDMINTRYQIIQFGEEISLGTRHTREHWNIINKKIDEYEDYCKTHPKFPNSEAVATIALIQSEFAVCLKSHDFL